MKTTIILPSFHSAFSTLPQTSTSKSHIYPRSPAIPHTLRSILSSSRDLSRALQSNGQFTPMVLNTFRNISPFSSSNFPISPRVDNERNSLENRIYRRMNTHRIPKMRINNLAVNLAIKNEKMKALTFGLA